jgi:hypothetical protein
MLYIKPIYALLGLLLFTACHSTNQAFLDKVKDADSVVINYFRGDGKMDTVVAVRTLKEKERLTLLSTFIAKGENAPAAKCGYDGSLHYFKRGMVLQDVDFTLHDVQCMQFAFLLNGKSFRTNLSPEAGQLLSGLKQ